MVFLVVGCDFAVHAPMGSLFSFKLDQTRELINFLDNTFTKRTGAVLYWLYCTVHGVAEQH